MNNEHERFIERHHEEVEDIGGDFTGPNSDDHDR